jgi:hypothetical protein
VRREARRGRKKEEERKYVEGNFFAKEFPSTPPFKKLLNGMTSGRHERNITGVVHREAPTSVIASEGRKFQEFGIASSLCSSQ